MHVTPRFKIMLNFGYHSNCHLPSCLRFYAHDLCFVASPPPVMEKFLINLMTLLESISRSNRPPSQYLSAFNHKGNGSGSRIKDKKRAYLIPKMTQVQGRRRKQTRTAYIIMRRSSWLPSPSFLSTNPNPSIR